MSGCFKLDQLLSFSLFLTLKWLINPFPGVQESTESVKVSPESKRCRKPNTITKKRRMRRKRKNQRKSVSKLKRELKEVHAKADHNAKKVIRLTTMARSYWERWRWELQKRKEALSTKPIDKRMDQTNNIHEIDELLLSDLGGGENYLVLVS